MTARRDRTLMPPPDEFAKLILRFTQSRLIGLTYPEEHAYLYWYTRDCYGGEGVIVDLGCLLGATTIALAQGLADNRASKAQKRVIHAYDRFVWEEWMESMVEGTELETRFHGGDSIRRAFDALVRPWKDRIAVHHGEVEEIGWSGEPIEFLQIDIMKTWGTASSVMRRFFPSLIPGVSSIVHQDFAHYMTPWIHPIMFRLRRWFVPVGHIAGSHSVVYQYASAVPEVVLQTEYGPQMFSTEEIDDAFDYSMGLVSGKWKANVAAAKIEFYRQVGDIERAGHALQAAKDANLPWDESELPQVAEKLSGSKRQRGQG